MSKGLYAIMGVGVLFVVSSLVEEGGPIDSLASSQEPRALASNDADGASLSQAPDVVLARTQAPPAASSPGWFDEAELAEPRAIQPPVVSQPRPRTQRPRPQRQRPQRSQRVGNSGDVGAIPAHRMNLEE